MEVYDRPASVFVSNFVGTANLLPGKVERQDGELVHVRLDCGARIKVAGQAHVASGARVFVCVRPEWLHLDREAGEDALPGTVRTVVPLGAIIVYEIEVADDTVVRIKALRDVDRANLGAGERIFINFTQTRGYNLFKAGVAAAGPSS